MSFPGHQGPELVGYEQPVEPVQDAGQGYGLPPQGGWEGVDRAQLWDENLLLVKVLPLAFLCLLTGVMGRITLTPLRLCSGLVL